MCWTLAARLFPDSPEANINTAAVALSGGGFESEAWNKLLDLTGYPKKSSAPAQ